MENEKNKSAKLFERVEYAEIFNIVTDDKLTHVCVGNQVVAQPFGSLEEAKEYIDQKGWGLIANVIITLIKKLQDYESLQASLQQKTQTNDLGGGLQTENEYNKDNRTTK